MFALLVLALAFQVTPAPSPSATAPASPSPSAAPSASPVLVGPPAVNLHPGQAQTFPIRSGIGPYTASVDTPAVTVTIDQAARTLAVTASQQTGRGTITLNDSTGAIAQIPVRVALDAGTIPASVTLRITGTQPDPQWLQTQIQKALLQSATVQPGALVQVQPSTLPASLGPGVAAAVPVPVHIAGGDSYFDVNGFTSVDLQNVAAAPFTPPLLLYDDDPERIDATGVLFRASIQPQMPARLYYYHENTAADRDLALIFASQGRSTLQLIDASAGPNVDVMSVGHVVSRNFLAQKPLNEGIVADVSSDAPYVAEHFLLHRLDGVAGSVGIRILSGAPVTLTVVSLPFNTPLTPAQTAQYLALPQLPGDGHHRTGAFWLQNYGQRLVPYTAGGPDASVQYGAQSPPPAPPQVDPVTTGHDFGEYGVLRTLDFEITNPLDRTQTLYLYERPLGGPVRSSFLVNGQLVELGCARVSNRYQIGAPLAVGPHASLALPVQTMTDGGSNYPLEVGLTDAPPLPAVPPIDAPDGCFPKPEPSTAPF